MAYSPAPLALDRTKPGQWNVEGAFVAPEYQGLWRGLAGGLAMWDAGARKLYDLVEGDADLNATDVTWDTWFAGPAIRSLPSFGGIDWNRSFIDIVKTSDKTIVAYVGDIQTHGTPTGRVITLFQGSGSTNLAITLSESGGNDHWQYIYRNPNFTTVTTTVVANDGRDHIAVLSQDGSTVTLYVDGVQISQRTDATTPSSATANNADLMKYDSSGEDMKGVMYMALVYDRGLSSAEVALLSADPYGLIRPNWDYLSTAFSSTSLYATGDGTIADVVNESDAATPLSPSVDDDPASPDDNDWVNNGVGV